MNIGDIGLEVVKEKGKDTNKGSCNNLNGKIMGNSAEKGSVFRDIRDRGKGSQECNTLKKKKLNRSISKKRKLKKNGNLKGGKFTASANNLENSKENEHKTNLHKQLSTKAMETPFLLQTKLKKDTKNLLFNATASISRNSSKEKINNTNSLEKTLNSYENSKETFNNKLKKFANSKKAFASLSSK